MNVLRCAIRRGELASRRLGRAYLVVIEDGCQACGASYKGRRVGSFGRMAGFSLGDYFEVENASERAAPSLRSVIE